MLLRSLQQAKYYPESLGHFGLSTDFYTHFTSPIRRYPDLIVHRLIRTYLVNGDVSHETVAKWRGVMDEIADHTSDRERRAVEAERDTDALKKAQYMSDKIGEEFDGLVSSVTNFGIFIELPNTVEGLVHISNMVDDYYNFDQRSMSMIGERTGRQFRIGDEVKIRVTNVNLEESAIDFEIVGMVESFGNRGPRKVQTRVINAGRREPKRGSDRDRGRSGGGSRGRGRFDERGASSSTEDRKEKRQPRGKSKPRPEKPSRDPRGSRKDGGKPFYASVAKKGKNKKKK